MTASRTLPKLPAPLVRIVDDDDEVRASLQFMLECEGIAAAAYPTAKAFLADFDRRIPGCILLDVRLPDVSGPDIQAVLALEGADVPIIFITSYGDVETAVEALKAGAADFLLKPVDGEKLLDVVRKATAGCIAKRSGLQTPENLLALVESLSPQPKAVLRFMLEGAADGAVAERMGLSERTVQIYRQKVYRTFSVHSAKQFALLAPAIAEALEKREALARQGLR